MEILVCLRRPAKVAALATSASMLAASVVFGGIGPAAPGMVLARGKMDADGRPWLGARQTDRPPLIDGLLDDEAWRDAPLGTGDWLSYNPLYGDRIPQRTAVWVAYDESYLYIAFKCDDPEPGAIKTSITRRDNIWADDWVGLSLDALGTGQFSYHLMVNPNGVQADMLNSAAGGEDLAPDFVWDSAGRPNDRGYAVEIRLPLQTIRFASGHDVRMGILFWRRVSRLGVSVSWPALDPGKWVFERNASMSFPNLQPRLAREVIPATTYSGRQARETPDAWGEGDHTGDVGFSTRFGLTPTVTLDATVNPDFSQVESDAFQVEVNQRFPVFYSEKRPFFMEGAGIYTLAGQGNDNSLQRAVHTRQIVDPVFGAKVTGTSGRLSYGALSAVDEAPGHTLEPTDPDHDKERLFNIIRTQYSLGPSNYVGAIVTDTEFAGGYNRVAGADLSWRVNSTQRLTGFVLASATREPRAPQSKQGMGGQVGYEYSTRRVTLLGYGEHYDQSFEMQTAFINRVGLTSGWGYVEYNFYPDKKRYPWLFRVSPFSFTQGGRDREGGGNELLEVYGVRVSTTRQGFLRADRFEGFETWAGRRFDRGRWRFMGEAQLYRWLALDGRYTAGDAVYYDPVEPFQGNISDIQAGLTLQPNGRLSQRLTFQRVTFDREATGERVYDLDIAYSQTTYQFTRQFFLRGILQYDSSRYQILTDFLASYELRPGTLVYAGYGSLLEQRDYTNGEWVLGQGDYNTSQRGVFFKASYLHRF